MNSRPTGVCGHQDCNEPTTRPDHPLCYKDYQDLRDGLIDECPHCSGVYKPADYPVCRRCHAQSGRSSQGTANGWDREPTRRVAAVPRRVVEAVALVSRNLQEHARECENHESNTIQYLVEPMLWGLGWDVYNPHQVAKEFKLAGRRNGGQGMAVDIALMAGRVPKVFIEAKRLDRKFDPDYEAQLARYAFHLEEGKAVLTNGRFWHVYAVVHGNPGGRRIVDMAEGDAEAVAGALIDAIGTGPSEGAPEATPASQTVHPQTIAANLKEYRGREARRRNCPAYAILWDKTVDLIARHQPADLRQLGRVSGVGRSTLEEHGAAILAIVRGGRPA